jgi:predicted MFS family arabinose efflux permease
MSAGMTLSALTHHESTRGTAMGIAMLGVALGTLTGPPMGGIMGNFLPLWSPYVVVGGLLLFNAAAQVYVLHMPSSPIPVYIKEANEAPARPLRSLSRSRSMDQGAVSFNHDRPLELQFQLERQMSRTSEHHTEVRVSQTLEEVVSVFTLLNDRKILVVVVVAITGNACIGMIEPLVPLYLHNTFNSSLLQQGLIFATATASYLIFTPIGGTLSDSYPKWSCLCVGLAALAFGLGFLYAGTGIFRVCVSLFFVGAGMSFIDTPSLPLLSEIIEVSAGI